MRVFAEAKRCVWSRLGSGLVFGHLGRVNLYNAPVSTSAWRKL